MGMSYWTSIQNDPERVAKYREYQRVWRKKTREKIRASRPPVMKPAPKSKAELSRRHRKKAQALARQQIFGHYGTSCVRCGESDPLVLTIDHIDQRGCEHKPGNRKNRISGYVLYQWLVKNNFPEGYRTACANCQIRFYREYRDEWDMNQD